jgi:hypothetical protein
MPPTGEKGFGGLGFQPKRMAGHAARAMVVQSFFCQGRI